MLYPRVSPAGRFPFAGLLALAATLAATACESTSSTSVVAPLVVTIAYPEKDATVPSVLTVRAEVTGGMPPVTVSFKTADGTAMAGLTEAPYYATLDLGEAEEDSTEIVVEAVDARGGKARASVPVTIDRALGAGDARPAVRLIYPLAGAAVCGTLDVQASASDDRGVERVRFFLDGKEVRVVTQAPYLWTWNTSQSSAGRHTIKVAAEDASARSTLDTIIVEVKPGAAACDNLPSVIFIEPAPGAIVRGAVRLAAQASDDVGVTSVQFFIDGSLLVEDDQVPFAGVWNTEAFAEGAHLLRAVARDTGGQIGKQDLTLTVDRSPPVVDFADLEHDTRLLGEVTIDVDAEDKYGLYGVRLGAYQDGRLVRELGVIADPPFSFEWDADKLPGGRYELRAEARDMTGLTSSVSRPVILGLASGQPCAKGFACETGQCWDKVCCETSCGDSCRSCALPASVGKCQPVKGAEDPGTCAGSSACGVNGVCQSKLGQACSAATACLSGRCIDGACCDTACDGTCMACNVQGAAGTCSPVKSREDPPTCSGVASCNADGACVRSLGAACSKASECASGNCVDGVCCNSACDGTCVACQLAGSAGTCTPMSKLAEDASVFCTGEKRCDGAGACKLITGVSCNQGTECVGGACVAGRCCSDQACTPAYGWTGVYQASSYYTANSQVTSLAAIEQSHLLIGGFLFGTVDLDLSSTYRTVNASSGSGFLSRIDGQRNLQWAHGFGAGMFVRSVASAANAAYAAGVFGGSAVDFDPSSTASALRTPVGKEDGFLLKLDSNGGYVWDRVLRASSATDQVRVERLDVAPDGSLVVVGHFVGSADFDPGDGVETHASTEGNLFVMKLTADGALSWSRRVQADPVTPAYVATGPDGAVVYAGSFTGQVDLDPTEGTDVRTAVGEKDAFVTKLKPDGTYAWSRTAGGTGAETGLATVLGDGTVVLGGNYNTAVTLQGETSSETPPAPKGIYFGRYDRDGGYLGRTLVGTGVSMSMHGLGKAAPEGILITGLYTGPVDFDPGTGEAKRTGVSGQGFLARYRPDGSFAWVINSASSTIPPAATSLPDGGHALGGQVSNSFDFDPGSNVDYLGTNGYPSGFITRLLP